MDDVGSQSGAGGELPDAREITTKLAAALNAHDLCEALLSIATPLGAGAGLVYLVDRRGELRLQSSRGAARWAQAHPTLPVGASVPLAAVFATGTEMFAETHAELEQRDPAAARLETSLRAAAALPLVHDRRG